MRKYLLMIQTFSPALRRMLIAQGCVGIGVGIIAVLLNLYLRELGYSEEFIGRLLAIQSLAAAFASVPMGWIADKYSRRISYVIGAFSLATGCLILSFSCVKSMLVFAALIAGTGNGGLMVSIQPFLQEHSRRKQRSYLYSVNFTITFAMNILSGILAGFLPGFFFFLGIGAHPDSPETLRWPLICGVAFIFLAVPQAFKLPQDPKKPLQNVTGETGCPEAQSFPRSLILKFMLTSGLIGLGAGLIVPFFNLYFRDWVGSTVQGIGLVFALGQFGTAVGGTFSPWISRKFGLVIGVVLIQFFSLPFMLIMAYSHNFGICALCYFFRGAFMNMSVPLRQEMLMSTVPESFRARASAADSVSWNIAWAFSMLFSGHLIKTWGYDHCLFLCFLIYFLSSILYFHFFAHYSHPLNSKRV
ncbi:MAG: MFS transporter [Candidatus Ozemobacteraceae bacterium]